MDLSLSLPSESSDHVSPLPSITMDFKVPVQSPCNDSIRSTNLSKIYSVLDRPMPLVRKEPESEILLENPESNLVAISSDCETDSLSYADCLISMRSPEKLVQKFMSEPSKLKISRAKDYSFSIKDSYKRLKIENPIKLVDPFIIAKLARSKNAMNHELLKAVVSVDKTTLRILNAYNCYALKFSSISGVMLGNSAYNFQQLSRIGMSYREVDCMTVVTEYRSYDIVVLDDTLRYDLYLYLSWQISNYSKRTSLIPLSKQQFSVHIARKKIKEMASEKSLFTNELILLAIFKTLVQMNAEKSKIDKIWALLKRFMLFPQKILRIFYLMKPKNFRVSNKFREKFDFHLRNQTLQARIADKAINKYPNDVLKPKYTPDSLYTISKTSLSGLFPRKKCLKNSNQKEERSIFEILRSIVLKKTRVDLE